MRNEQENRILSKLNEGERAFRENFAYRVYVIEVVYAKECKVVGSKEVHHVREDIVNYCIVSTDNNTAEMSKLQNQFWLENWYGIKKWLDDGYFILYLDNDFYDVRREDQKLFDSLNDYQKLQIVRKFYGFCVNDNTIPTKEILHGQCKF